MELDNLKVVYDNIDIDIYIHERELVKNEMNYPEWLGDFSREQLVDMVNNGVKIYMYYDNEQFVCSMMLIPSSERSAKKMELSFDYREIVDYGPMFVNYGYIGKGLQYQMLLVLDKISKELGYKYAVVTVHPDNVYSIRNILKSGFEQIGIKTFSRGERMIFFKKL